MNLRNMLDDDRWSPSTVLIAGIVTTALVIGGIAFALNASDPEPVAVIASDLAQPPADAPSEEVRLPPSAGAPMDDLDGETSELLDGPATTTTIEMHLEDEVPDYSATPIPPDQYNVVFPPSRAPLDAPTFKLATDQGAALVRAQITGEGRQLFPGYFSSRPDPGLPYATNFRVQFATASAVPGHPQLIRTVVLWEGIGSGNVTFLQVRIANYFAKNADGSLTAVKNDFLPPEIRQSDALINGVSIIG